MKIFESKPTGATWPVYQHVIFDCDSTLSRVEGIDLLADEPDERARIESLTNAAMTGEQALEDVYEKRLDMVGPTRGDVSALAQCYRDNIVEDANLVISALLAAGIDVYIVSGGLIEPVKDFGTSLGVPADNIYAVPLVYDELAGEWWKTGSQRIKSHDQPYLTVEPSRLTESDGKAEVIQSILSGKTGRSTLIGDGVSDLAAAGEVDLFVGYGGVIHRPPVAKKADIYINSGSILPMLPIAVGSDIFNTLDSELQSRVREMCRGDPMQFRSEQLANKYQQCFC